MMRKNAGCLWVFIFIFVFVVYTVFTDAYVTQYIFIFKLGRQINGMEKKGVSGDDYYRLQPGGYGYVIDSVEGQRLFLGELMDMRPNFSPIGGLMLVGEIHRVNVHLGNLEFIHYDDVFAAFELKGFLGKSHRYKRGSYDGEIFRYLRELPRLDLGS
jgi:hypothetical protein